MVPVDTGRKAFEMSTTYTILDGEGYVIDRHVSLSGAADYIMTSDSRRWDIREDDDGGFVVWSDQQVANVKWHKIGAIFSIKSDRADAEREICEQIVNSDRWSGHYEAMTDASYDDMMRQVAIDNGDEED